MSTEHPVADVRDPAPAILQEDSQPRERSGSRIGAMLQEAMSHAILFGVIIASGLGFGGALLLLAADLLLVIVLSIPVHRAYSVGRYLWGLVLTIGLLAFLLAMCVFAYGVTMMDHSLQNDAVLFARIFPFEPGILVWMVAVSALHLMVMFVYAWTQPDPRKAWDRMTAIAGGSTFLSLLLLAFVIAFLGESAIAFARWFSPELGADPVLVALMIGLRCAFACALLLLPESVWQQDGQSLRPR